MLHGSGGLKVEMCVVLRAHTRSHTKCAHLCWRSLINTADGVGLYVLHMFYIVYGKGAENIASLFCLLAFGVNYAEVRDPICVLHARFYFRTTHTHLPIFHPPPGSRNPGERASGAMAHNYVYGGVSM